MPLSSGHPLRVEQFTTLDASGAAAWGRVRTAGGPLQSDEPLPPGAEGLIAYRGERPVARAGYGMRSDFVGSAGRTGFVGWYEAVEPEAGVEVLRVAVDALASAGAGRVVGPLNGTTWSRYRLTLPPRTPGESAPPFLTEPTNPAEYPEQFLAAGFGPLLEYESRWVPEPRADPDAERVSWPRLKKRGVAVRDLDVGRFDEELRALYELSVEAFSANPFYSPISFEEFAKMYHAVRPLLDPALVRVAVGPGGRLMGFVFAFTDPLSPAGSPRVVLKTLAAARDARGLGLGRTLVDDVNRTAAARGHGVIHALMQRSNVSRNISERSESLLFRRYALYAAEEP